MHADHETPRDHDLPAGTAPAAHDQQAGTAQTAPAAHDNGHDKHAVAHDKHAGHSVAMAAAAATGRRRRVAARGPTSLKEVVRRFGGTVSPGRQMPRSRGTMTGSIVRDAKRTRPPEVRGRRGSVFGAG